MMPAGRAILLARLVLLWLVFTVPVTAQMFSWRGRPFIVAGNDHAILPKAAAAMLGVLALWAALSWGGAWRRLKGHPLLPILGALLFVSALTVPWAVNAPQAFRLLMERAGWILVCLGAAAVAPGLGRVALAAGAAVAVQFVLGMMQAGEFWVVGHGTLFGPGRVYGSMGNPSYLGVWLAPVAVVLLAAASAASKGKGSGALPKPSPAERLLTPLLAALGLSFALWLMGRTAVIDAWAGFAVGGALALYLARPRGNPHMGRRVKLVAGLVLVAGISMALYLLVPRLWDRLDYLKVKSFSWHAAAVLWRDRPVLGNGPGGFQTLAPGAMARVHALWTEVWKVNATLVCPHDEAWAHQDYLQFLAESGAAGFGLLVLAAIVAVRFALRRGGAERAAWVGALVAFVPTMAMHFPFNLPASGMVFWLLLGLACAPGERPGDEDPAPIPARLAIPVIAVLLGAIVARGFTVNLCLGEGYRAFRSGAPAIAAMLFEKCERLDPNNYEERFYSGALYQSQGDQLRAMNGYERAIELYPGMQGAIYNLGNLFMAMRRYDRAVEAYDKAIAVNPCLFEAWNNRGNSLVQSRREKEARESYLKAVAVNPAYPDALFNIALSYNRSGDRAAAREWLRKTLAVDGGYKPARDTAAAWGMKTR